MFVCVINNLCRRNNIHVKYEGEIVDFKDFLLLNMQEPLNPFVAECMTRHVTHSPLKKRVLVCLQAGANNQAFTLIKIN